MSSLIKTVFGMLEKTQLKSINCTITSKRKDSFDPKCWDVKSPKHVYQNLETTVKGNYNTISFYSHSLHGNPASRLFVSVLCALHPHKSQLTLLPFSNPAATLRRSRRFSPWSRRSRCSSRATWTVSSQAWLETLETPSSPNSKRSRRTSPSWPQHLETQSFPSNSVCADTSYCIC